MNLILQMIILRKNVNFCLLHIHFCFCAYYVQQFIRFNKCSNEFQTLILVCYKFNSVFSWRQSLHIVQLIQDTESNSIAEKSFSHHITWAHKMILCSLKKRVDSDRRVVVTKKRSIGPLIKKANWINGLSLISASFGY